MPRFQKATRHVLSNEDFLEIHAQRVAVYGDEQPPKSEWTVNGEPIKPEIAHLLPFENTDQGIGERMALGLERGTARTQTVRDAADKRITEQFRDERIERRVLSSDEMRAVQSGSANRELLDFADPDPLKTCARANVPPGYAYRFLSEQATQDQGLRGYQIVKDADGKEVKVGTLRLGIIPAEVADYRHTRQQELNEAPMKEMKAVAKAKKEAGGDDTPIKGQRVIASEDSALEQDPTFHEAEV